jgi:hypothetical protein
MTTSNRNDPDDREGSSPALRPSKIQATARAVTRCRLCRETIVLESNFRPTPATCPHCGLEFVFDPQGEPLPVRGMRLRHSAVLETQRRHGAASGSSSTAGTVHHRRHPAHTHRIVRSQEPKASYMAWAVGLALSLAATAAFLSGWFHRLLSR